MRNMSNDFILGILIGLLISCLIIALLSFCMIIGGI